MTGYNSSWMGLPPPSGGGFRPQPYMMPPARMMQDRGMGGAPQQTRDLRFEAGSPMADRMSSMMGMFGGFGGQGFSPFGGFFPGYGGGFPGFGGFSPWGGFGRIKSPGGPLPQPGSQSAQPASPAPTQPAPLPPPPPTLPPGSPNTQGSGNGPPDATRTYWDGMTWRAPT